MLKLLRKRALLIVLLLFGLVYLAYGHYLGQMTEKIMLAALEEYRYVENNPYKDVISDEYFNHFVKRDSKDFTELGNYDKYHITNPFVLHWFIGAKVWVKYSYEYYLDNNLQSGKWNSLVYFELNLQNGQWKIIDMYETP